MNTLFAGIMYLANTSEELEDGPPLTYFRGQGVTFMKKQVPGAVTSVKMLVGIITAKEIEL
jgi:hypothetical protein